ncbi:MAG: Hsp20/alpha crystallin family protein [Bacilli bacterium]
MSDKYEVANRGGYGLLDPFIDDLFDFPFLNTKEANHYNQVMKADVSDEGDHYLVKLDVPSINKKDIKISLKEGYLNVSATTSSNNDEKDKHGKYIRRERFYGTYSRSFYVGDEVKESDINAKLENGVLALSVAKKEAPKLTEKYIEIK